MSNNRKEYYRQWYLNNQEEVKAKRRQWYLKNRERILANSKTPEILSAKKEYQRLRTKKLREETRKENLIFIEENGLVEHPDCLLYTSPSPRDYAASRMPSSA